jgi:hypothetical protein
MKFLFLIAHDDSFAPTPKLLKAIHAWVDNAESTGLRLAGAPLVPAQQGRTVRVRQGKTRVANGPFSKSREQVCAYELVECESFEAAVEAAKSHPMATAATIEVRPVWENLTNG